jgi:hypothetical protein
MDEGKAERAKHLLGGGSQVEEDIAVLRRARCSSGQILSGKIIFFSMVRRPGTIFPYQPDQGLESISLLRIGFGIKQFLNRLGDLVKFLLPFYPFHCIFLIFFQR